jgi:hypothetical protein
VPRNSAGQGQWGRMSRWEAQRRSEGPNMTARTACRSRSHATWWLGGLTPGGTVVTALTVYVHVNVVEHL